MAGVHEYVKVKVKGRALDVLREMFSGQLLPGNRKASLTINRYVMDLILDDHKRGLMSLSELR